MDYITIHTLRKLQSVGFAYPEYEHFRNVGMVYYYQNDDYLLGGFSGGAYSETDKEAAANGQWLPSASQLLEWLNSTGFFVSMTMDEGNHYTIYARDKQNGLEYRGGGYSLADALAKVIYKICKSSYREYAPRTKLRLQLE